MPGRVSSGTLSVKKSAPPTAKAKRLQNALAIAEQQAPVRSKIKHSRLGHSESELPKRKRRDDDDESVVEEDSSTAKRRRREEKDRFGNAIEYGSDSSGNEWTIGQVDDDESEIDSDDAMADSDDDGIAIRGSMANSSGPKHNPKVTTSRSQDGELQRFDLSEGDDDVAATYDESGSFGSDAVDLAAILDASDDGGGLPDGPDAPSQNGADSESDSPGGTTSEAEADESALSFSEDEVDEADAAKLASLQVMVSTMNEQDQNTRRTKTAIDPGESMTPSEFGLNPKRKLTVADLIPSITDPKLRKSLKLIADDTKSVSKPGRIPKKLDVPLPKRQQDRLDRAAAYEKSKETLNRWIDTVKHNRRAEHLSFPLKDPNAAIAQGSTRLLTNTQAQPLTDLESTVQSILQDSGLAGPSGRSGESQLQAFEELKTKKLPLEEVQARRAELRRARELLFREEVRAKRIKKIKSKTYRKVHRKERERNIQHEKDRLIADGVDDSESEQERKDRRRAEERMGARHRESRWAKGIKDSGRAKWDEDARGGVTELARRGEELRRRIEGKPVDEDEDGLASSETEEYDDEKDEFDDGNTGNDVLTRKRIERLDRNDAGLEAGAKGSRLASMDFMKNAEVARKARNDAELQSLRQALDGEEVASEEEDVEGPGREAFGPLVNKENPPNRTKATRSSEFEEREGSESETQDGPGQPEETEVEILVDTAGTNGTPGPSNRSRSRNGQRKLSSTVISEPNVEAMENPFLIQPKRESKVEKTRGTEPSIDVNMTKKAAASTVSNPRLRSIVKDAQKAEQSSKSKQKDMVASTRMMSDDESDADTADKPFVLRNHDLVAKAFAGDKIVEDFEAEKKATMEDEDERVIDSTIPGWGSWTGAGIGKKAQMRNKKGNMTKQPGIAKDKRKDAKLDRVIINEKRIKKNGKYLASSLPHPFETMQQYQRSLRMPIGPEFQTKLGFQDATKPRVLMKQGIIAPMVKPTI